MPMICYLSGWTMPSLSASLHHSQAPIPSSSLCSSLDFFPLCPSTAYTRKLRIGLSISCVTSLVLRRGKGSQSQPPGNVMLFLTQPWRGCLPSLPQGHVAGSLSIWNTRAFSAKLLPSQSAVVFLQVTAIPLNVSTSMWFISHSPQFCIIFKLAGGALCPVVQVVRGDNETYQP